MITLVLLPQVIYSIWSYDNPIGGSGSVARKNGEIANIKWQRRNSTLVGGVNGYTYSDYGELLGNNYSTITGPSTIGVSTKFDETFSFGSGKAGKITAQSKRNSSGALIDNLTYVYATNSYQTIRVNDSSGSTIGHNQNGQSATAVIYTYDLNDDRMVPLAKWKSSATKALDNEGTANNWIAAWANLKLIILININYNHLNLPTLIDYGSGKRLELIYDANGNMVNKKVYSATTTLVENRTYNNGMEFVAYGTGNQAIEMIHHEQGYFRPSNGLHYYTIADHLYDRMVALQIEPTAWLNNEGTVELPHHSLEYVNLMDLH